MPSAHPTVGVRRGVRPSAGHPALRASGALLLSMVAVALVVTTFGILSLPLALGAMALARSARRQPGGAGPVAAVAWWVSLIAVAISAIALLVVALDLAGVGSPDEGVQEAH